MQVKRCGSRRDPPGAASGLLCESGGACSVRAARQALPAKMKHSRFLRHDQDEVKKLRDRVYNRESRVRPTPASESERGRKRKAGSRSQPCPCCNARSNECRADFSEVVPFADVEEINRCARAVYNGCLMSSSDTADFAKWNRKVKEHKGIWSWEWCWAACSLVRYFNNPVLTDILWEQDLLQPECEPKWEQIQALIAERYAAKPKQKVFGGYYDPPVMTHFSSTAELSLLHRAKPWNRQALPVTCPGWYSTSCLGSAERDVFAARLIWKSTPTAELNRYAAAPSRDTFTALYEKFRSTTKAVVKGAMGPYQLKCTLDPLTSSGWISQGHLAVWPVTCPGYMKGYSVFFPKLPPAHRLQALYFFHRKMKAKVPMLCFPEAVSHMCWDSRRTSGALHDSLSAFVKGGKRKATKGKSIPRKRTRAK